MRPHAAKIKPALKFDTLLLEGASHSMYYVGESDFPYWSKLHPDYLVSIKDWITAIAEEEQE